VAKDEEGRFGQTKEESVILVKQSGQTPIWLKPLVFEH
jgi:hypothetical protein